ncbi:nuclear transport factor 2 family protein [Nocardioides sp. Kera G14]|uniref:nuclear transport factor 2 family protein n=1 Tax=Nocardioides sp. Kera G14 TaxID=2884264 RepID=UPI001D10C4B9|nr:nuclear transport factor 2 family protein [Nocardioides sp. Kera G14]UDY22203.1 nuclear transport factor 2 family protein [Nocardioides sp. Kera G14]
MTQLDARAEIVDALTRYTLAVDRGDWDLLDTVFTPDAAIDYSESGGIVGSIAEAKPWLAENLPAFSAKRLHMLGQIAVEFDSWPGDSAQVTAYFHNPMVISDGAGGERVVEVGGLYHHHFVRTSTGWRSNKLHEELVWSRGF